MFDVVFLNRPSYLLLPTTKHFPNYSAFSEPGVQRVGATIPAGQSQCPGDESWYLFHYCCASPPGALSMPVICFLSQICEPRRSRIFEPSLAAYAIDLPHRFLVSVVSASDLNGIGIMDDPVQNGVRNGFLRELSIPAGRNKLSEEDS